MATPRKRYFRVADSILREPWDRDEKLTLVLLMAHLNTRWARDGIPDEEAGRCVLGAGDLVSITGRSRADKALLTLSKLSHRVSLTVSKVGDHVSIDWPKFAEFQEYASRTKGSRNANESPLQSESESESITKTKKEEKRGRATASRSTRSPRSAPAAFPGSMTGADWDALGRKHGVDPGQLLEVAADWAGEKDRGYTAAGWSKAINRALRDRWEWTRSLFAVPGRSDLQNRETPAQARERHTFEAARRVAERITHDPIQLAIVAQTKGAA